MPLTTEELLDKIKGGDLSFQEIDELEREQLSYVSETGNTLLHLIYSDNIKVSSEIVTRLSNRLSADNLDILLTANNNGYLPIHYVIKNRKDSAEILKNQLDILGGKKQSLLLKGTRDGFTIFHFIAFYHQNPITFQIALEQLGNKALTPLKEYVKSWSVLHFLVHKNSLDSLNILFLLLRKTGNAFFKLFFEQNSISRLLSSSDYTDIYKLGNDTFDKPHLISYIKICENILNRDITTTKKIIKTISEGHILNFIIHFANTGILNSLEAIDLIDEYLPNTAEDHINKGWALCSFNRYRESLVSYEDALHLDPKNSYIYLNKAHSFLFLGEFDNSLACYEEAIGLETKDSFVQTMGHIGKGNVFMQSKRYYEALKNFIRALELNPTQREIEYCNELKRINTTFFLPNEGKSQNANFSLFLAIAEKDIEKVKLSIAQGANTIAYDSEGFPPLLRAAQVGNMNILDQLLLCKEVTIKDAHHKETGRGVLYEASLHGNLDAVKYLVKKEVKVNFITFDEETAMHACARSGHVHVAKYLKESKWLFNSLNDRNEQGQTPLILASIEGHEHFVEWLLENNVEWNVRDSANKTALEYAKEHRHVNIHSRLAIIKKQITISSSETKKLVAEDKPNRILPEPPSPPLNTDGNVKVRSASLSSESSSSPPSEKSEKSRTASLSEQDGSLSLSERSEKPRTASQSSMANSPQILFPFPITASENSKPIRNSGVIPVPQLSNDKQITIALHDILDCRNKNGAITVENNTNLSSNKIIITFKNRDAYKNEIDALLRTLSLLLKKQIGIIEGIVEISHTDLKDKPVNLCVSIFKIYYNCIRSINPSNLTAQQREYFLKNVTEGWLLMEYQKELQETKLDTTVKDTVFGNKARPG